MRNEKHFQKLKEVQQKIVDGPFEEIKHKVEKEYHSFGMIFDFLQRDFPELLPNPFSKKQLGKILTSLGLIPDNKSYNKQPNSFKLQYRYNEKELMNFALKGQKQTVEIRNRTGSYFEVAKRRGVEGRRKNSPRCIEFYISRGFSKEEAEKKISVLATKGALASLKKVQSPRTERMISDFLATENVLYHSQFAIKTNKPDTFGRKTYVYDFLLPKNNLVIEVNGTYWHCDKRFWSEGDKIKLPGKGETPCENVWLADQQKVETAEKIGYDVLVIWEHDIYTNFQKVQKEILNEICRTSRN